MATNYVIPIYLDINTMLDLLASMEEGFTLAEKITTTSNEKAESETSVGAGFGISQMISFFKLDFSAQHQSSDSADQSKKHESQRYHTYGSLLNKLRSNLLKKESGLVKIINNSNDWNNVKISDFIEIHGTFKSDPFVKPINTLNESIDGVKSLLNEKMFENKDTPNADAKRNYKNLERSMQEVQTALNKMVSTIKGDDPVNKIAQRYLVNLSGLTDHKVIVSLFPEYLRDRTGVELPNGNFYLLGKVVSILKTDQQYSLVQNTKLAGVSDFWIQQLLTDRFKRIGETSSAQQNPIFNIDELEPSITGPMMKVIPISIYV